MLEAEESSGAGFLSLPEAYAPKSLRAGRRAVLEVRGGAMPLFKISGASCDPKAAKPVGGVRASVESGRSKSFGLWRDLSLAQTVGIASSRGGGGGGSDAGAVHWGPEGGKSKG